MGDIWYGETEPVDDDPRGLIRGVRNALLITAAPVAAVAVFHWVPSRDALLVISGLIGGIVVTGLYLVHDYARERVEFLAQVGKYVLLLNRSNQRLRNCQHALVKVRAARDRAESYCAEADVVIAEQVSVNARLRQERDCARANAAARGNKVLHLGAS